MKPQKKNSPGRPETILNQHMDIVYRIFGEIKGSVTFDEVWQVQGWLLDHKRELGRRYYVLRDWAELDLLDICELPKQEPVKRYTCRYCGHRVPGSEVTVADETIICRGCAYGY